MKCKHRNQGFSSLLVKTLDVIASFSGQLEQLEAQTSELKRQKTELARLGAGELIKVSQELLEEKRKNEDMLAVTMQLENMAQTTKQEIESLR